MLCVFNSSSLQPVLDYYAYLSYLDNSFDQNFSQRGHKFLLLYNCRFARRKKKNPKTLFRVMNSNETLLWLWIRITCERETQQIIFMNDSLNSREMEFVLI